MEIVTREIRRLPQEIVRLIAAGEVIERPASVVKELIENSLDAGAHHVEVKLINGGLTSIAVRDDGTGILSEQVSRLLERHTTNKISDEADLNAIITLGFRGEALYSMAAVSDLILSTRHRQEEAGTRLTWENGRKRIETISWPGGTQVESMRLFHSTPARRKFLRTSSAEYARAAELVQSYALAYPAITWVLMHNDRLTLRSPGTGDLMDAIIAVYGVETARRMIPVDGSEGSISVKGAVSAVDLTRARRTDQSIFLNGRLIRDASITSAVERAYETSLAPGRHPVAILSISCDPSQVDVNVHPHKKEVRLANPREITHVAYHAIKDALSGQHESRIVSEVTIDNTTGEVVIAEPDIAFVSDPREERQWGIREPKSRHDATLPEAGISAVPTDSRKPAPAAPLHEYPTFDDLDIYDREDDAEIFQFADMYVIYAKGGSVYLIDQHNLHERILYEKFRDLDRAASAASQTLLFPMQVMLTPSLAGLVDSHLEQLGQLGFEIEEFSEAGREKAFVMRAVPLELTDSDPVQALIDCLENVAREEDIDDPEVFRRAFSANLACKSAIKAGKKLSDDEMRYLAAHIEKGNYYTCPHGRPTIIRLDEDWFRRAFKRSQPMR
jgi:DNA mismatch repair protein MutL